MDLKTGIWTEGEEFPYSATGITVVKISEYEIFICGGKHKNANGKRSNV